MIIQRYAGPIVGVEEEMPYHFAIIPERIEDIRRWCQAEYVGNDRRYQIFGFTVLIHSAEDAALFRLAWG